jgi:hypothetical protein
VADLHPPAGVVAAVYADAQSTGVEA